MKETPVQPECPPLPAVQAAANGTNPLGNRLWPIWPFRGKQKKRWIILVVCLAALGGAGWLTVPHLQAWYHFRAGRAALERYHSDEARAHFDACLRTWPKSAEAHILAARAARRFGDLQSARDHLRVCQRLELTPSDESHFELTLLQACAGYLGEVEEYLLRRMEKDPAQAPLIWEALAQGCFRMYRFLDATNYLADWLQNDPDNVQALFLRGSLRQEVGEAAKAAQDFRKVVELDAERDDARRQLARSLLRTGGYEEALAHFEYLHKRRPGDTELLVNLARCQTELGRRDEARTVLAGVLAEHPDNALALQERGRLSLREGQAGEAEEWLRKAVRANPFDYYANWHLHDALLQQGKTEEAEEQMNRTRQIQDRMERLGKIKQESMSARPNDASLHCEVGTLLIGLGYKDLGEQWLQTALNQDKDYGPAHAALADLYEERGEAEKAAEERRLAKAAPVQTPSPTKP